MESKRGPITYAREVSDLIGRRADWTYRHGHLLLFATALLLIFGAYGYEFPATQQGELVLSTIDPPRALSAPREMEIDRVWVVDRDTVAAGQLLLTAANDSVRIEHILDLEDRLLQVDGSTGIPPSGLSLPNPPLPTLLSKSLSRYRDTWKNFTVDAPADQVTRAELHDAFVDLRERLNQWKRVNTFISPTAGIALLQPNLDPGTALERGELALTILPLEAGNTIGRLSLPVQGSGRLARGQKVIVRFAKYPHLEYGVVTGRINQIAAVPEGDRIAVEVAFPAGLVTTRGKRIEPTPFLRGEATVITGTRTLLNLLLNPD
jgi:hypothetical protein